jgi:hypothetical protein
VPIHREAIGRSERTRGRIVNGDPPAKRSPEAEQRVLDDLLGLLVAEPESTGEAEQLLAAARMRSVCTSCATSSPTATMPGTTVTPLPTLHPTRDRWPSQASRGHGAAGSYSIRTFRGYHARNGGERMAIANVDRM